MKAFLNILATLSLATSVLAQDYNSVASSALSVASSYVANHDMQSIMLEGLDAASSWVANNNIDFLISQGLNVASSWVANHDIDSVVSSVGSDIGITDSEELLSVYTRASELWASVTQAYEDGEYGSIDVASITSAVQAEATASGSMAAVTGSSSIEAAPVATVSSVGGADAWGLPAGAVFGSFVLGLAAYL
jgi:hypothetical protein